MMVTITDDRTLRDDEPAEDGTDRPDLAVVADPVGGKGTGESADAGGTKARPASPPRTGRHRRWPMVLCIVLAALGFAGTGYFGRAWLQQRSNADQQSQVRATATGFVQALTNFDPGTVDADFARIQSYATGQFATQARQFFGSSIRQQLQTAGAASRGQVRDLFVESLSGNDATVFAVVDQTYLNDKVKSAQADTLRLELDMTDLPGGWRISAVTVLQSPAGFPGSSGSPSGSGSVTGSGGTP
jgi:Mce-associated membrane protein